VQKYNFSLYHEKRLKKQQIFIKEKSNENFVNQCSTFMIIKFIICPPLEVFERDKHNTPT